MREKLIVAGGGFAHYEVFVAEVVDLAIQRAYAELCGSLLTHRSRGAGRVGRNGCEKLVPGRPATDNVGEMSVLELRYGDT